MKAPSLPRRARAAWAFALGVTALGLTAACPAGPSADAGPGPDDGGGSPGPDDAGDPPADDAGGRPEDGGGPEPDPDPDDGGLPPGPEGPTVEKVPGGGLRLVGAGPALMGQCPPGQCFDGDVDGLDDAWEQLVLETFRPLVRVTDDEPLLADPDGVFAFVGRVRLVQASPFVAQVYLMLGYSKDYGNCGLTGHNGDSERVVVELEAVPLGAAGDVQVRRAYTAAHEGTVTDHGKVYTGPELDTVLDYGTDEEGRLRWRVRSSRSKHATYGNAQLCADAFLLPCFAETCAADGAGEDLDAPVVNAGEDDERLVNDLGDLGFPGDFAWEDQDFCGGVREGGCSSSVRSKLTVDPFAG